MNFSLDDARCLSGAALAAALQDSRARTRAWTFDLDPAQWLPPEQAGVNPIAWELAHLAWFAEFWVLRGPHRVDQAGRVHAARPARIAGPDALFDSARLPHAGRWRAPLPARDELADRLDAQLDAGLAALAACDQDDDAALYVHRLALFHEDMHGEAFAWMRAALGWPAPAGVALPRVAASGTLQLPAAEVAIGWPAGRRGFAFDNEASAHRVALPAFEIDAEPVSAGRYLEFVEAGGYAQSRWWPGEAGRWRAQQPHPHPARWRRAAQWQQRWFDRWLPLDPQQPAMHLSAWEAEAFARWAGRRLPSAAEWEHAALARPETFRWGHGVWEWTASPFQPYPGFEPGPYRDYSAPWFGDHRELRGGAFATHARLHHARYRNFFQPARTDVFAGFRTAAS